MCLPSATFRGLRCSTLIKITGSRVELSSGTMCPRKFELLHFKDTYIICLERESLGYEKL